MDHSPHGSTVDFACSVYFDKPNQSLSYVCAFFSITFLFDVLLGSMPGGDFQLGSAAMKMSCLTNWGIRLYTSLPENQDSSCNTNHPSLCGTEWKGNSDLRLLGVLTKKLFEQIRLLLCVIIIWLLTEPQGFPPTENSGWHWGCPRKKE